MAHVDGGHILMSAASRGNRLLLLAGICLVLCPARVACGRVFERRGASESPTPSAAQMGWTSLYRAALRLNRGAANLEVMVGEEGLGTAAWRLQQLWRSRGAHEYIYTGDTMAWGIVLERDRVVRVLCVGFNEHETAVFLVAQTRADFLRSQQRPSEHMLRSLPAFPACRVGYYMADEQTRTALQVGRSDAAPRTVTDFYRARLDAAGWRPALPQRGFDPDSGLLAYVRRGETCFVFVNSAGNGEATLVTLLHRPRGGGTDL